VPAASRLEEDYVKSVVIAGMLCAEPFIKVAAVQMRSGADLKENCRKICHFVESLAAQGVKAAAFPECALTS
jgi:hypothetical protein